MRRQIQQRFRRLGLVTGAVLAGLWALGFLVATMDRRPAGAEGAGDGLLRDAVVLVVVGVVLFVLPYALARAIGGFLSEQIDERSRADARPSHTGDQRKER